MNLLELITVFVSAVYLITCAALSCLAAAGLVRWCGPGGSSRAAAARPEHRLNQTVAATDCGAPHGSAAVNTSQQGQDNHSPS